MLSDNISVDILPKMKMLIPILMHFCSFVSSGVLHATKTTYQLTIYDVITDILSHIFDVFQSDVGLHLQVHYNPSYLTGAQ